MLLHAQHSPVATALLVLACSTLLYALATAFYNVFLHPLRRFPGPRLHAMSRLPYSYKHTTGTLPLDMLTMHHTYGDIVRIAPDELAFSHPDAWKDIMGHSKTEMSKANWFYNANGRSTKEAHIINAPRAEHAALRRTLAHGFADRSMHAHEPLVQEYVGLLMRRLREAATADAPVPISDWYNFTTFDVIGALVFGEPFGCLASGEYHSWVRSIFQTVWPGTIMQSISFFTPVLIAGLVVLLVLPRGVLKARTANKAHARESLLRRMHEGAQRQDLIEGLVANRDKLGLSTRNLASNAEILIIAGSETTATLLSGATFFLTTHPAALKRVTREVRTAFASAEDISLAAVARLPYLQAVLTESLRLYPPVANGLPRVVPAGGAVILGQFVPEGTTVAIWQRALYRRADFFAAPESFAPERWLGEDDAFAGDKREALQPFHVGPRNCLGRNLAMAEMRLILARVLFEFDLQLDSSSAAWIEQRNYLFWEKGRLNVHLVPVRRDG